MTEEEISQLRGYLTSQSMRKTPAQLIDALQETYHQFVKALNSFPGDAFYNSSQEEAWSATEILEHVYLFMALYERAICKVLERGERPPDVKDREEILPRRQTIGHSALVANLESSLRHLVIAVKQADPDTRLDITWTHFELGPMHWREWLIFARVHLLDHVRQMQAM